MMKYMIGVLTGALLLGSAFAQDCSEQIDSQMPHYDIPNQELNLPYTYASFYNSAIISSTVMPYSLKMGVFAGTPSIPLKLRIVQMEALQTCDDTRRLATQNNVNLLGHGIHPVFSNDKIRIPYMKFGQNWMEIELSRDPETNHPLLFHITSIKTIDLADISDAHKERLGISTQSSTPNQ